jgi:hypothetical protein
MKIQFLRNTITVDLMNFEGLERRYNSCQLHEFNKENAQNNQSTVFLSKRASTLARLFWNGTGIQSRYGSSGRH